MSKRILRNTQYAILIALMATLFGALTVFAQNPTPTDDEVNKIAKQLFCPVCESTPLDVCPTQACHDWRELIREMLADGKSEAEIKQYFVEHFGARVLNEPPNKFASYAVPAAAFLLGAFMLFRGFQMWMKPSTTEAGVPELEAKPVPQDEYIARLEEEIKKQK
jgi:cytochrome c-type biogenesis protein CcmH